MPLKESAQRIQELLAESGYDNRVVELPDSTRTAQEAADAIGCDTAQIAKSIVFRRKRADAPLLVVASGANRVNEKKLAAEIGDKLEKADADFVRGRTGFVIGGAAVIAILLSFLGKFSALVANIPVAVMGGISLLLFGVIAASGLRMLVESKIDYGKPTNLYLTTIVLVTGLSGLKIKSGDFELTGMALATVVAIVFSLLFKLFEVVRLSNENEASESKH